MFLGSGDLRNALLTAAQCPEAHKKLDLHLSDSCSITTARNFLIAHILLKPDFVPTKNEDMDYLWSLWYGFQWDDATRKRFVKDIKQLLAMQWSSSQSPVALHEDNVNDCIKRIINSWVNTVCNMSPKTADRITQQRSET